MNRSALVTCLTAGVALLGLCASAGAQDGATIRGKVIFKGDPTARKFRRTVLDTSKDPNCRKSKQRIGSWSVILNRKTDPVTVRNVLVHIEEGLGDRKFDPPADPVVLNQYGCEYDPHVFGIMEGQKLLVRNSDPTNHNIHFLPDRNQEYNFTQPKKDMEQTLTLTAEAPFKVKCDVHPWMGAYVGVFKHPFFDTTRDEGTFEIKNLPPGKYVVKAWHEEFGEQTTTVEVASGETKEVDFTYSPGDGD